MTKQIKLCGDCPDLVAIRRRDLTGEIYTYYCSALPDLDSNKPGEALGFRDRRHELCPVDEKEREL